MTNFNGSINSFGTLSTNVDIPGVSEAKTDEVFRPIIDLKMKLQDALDTAKANGDTDAVADITSQMQELNTLANDIKTSIEENASTLGMGDPLIANHVLSTIAAKVATGVANFAANEVGSSASNELEVIVGGQAMANGTLLNTTPALNDGQAWSELANTNPEEFQRQLSELSESEQLQVQQSIQTNLQQMNRMFSMMTAISQAQHDTQKAIISNFRV